MPAAELQSPCAVMLLRCLAVRIAFVSPARVKIASGCVLRHRAARCTFRTPRRVSRFCKMLSCSWWESRARQDASHEGDRRRRAPPRSGRRRQINRAIFEWQHSALSHRCRVLLNAGRTRASRDLGRRPSQPFQPPASRGGRPPARESQGQAAWEPSKAGRDAPDRETPDARHTRAQAPITRETP